jgi:hypothetical protein
MIWLKEASNGEIFDTSGPLRVETRNEEFFVVGLGKLESVNSIFEGNQFIRDFRNKMICKENVNDNSRSGSYSDCRAVDRLR